MQTPKVLGGIDFGLMDPETYRDMSATKVITADTYNDDGYPIDMGLMDPRLGVIDPGLECRTCGSPLAPVTATSATSSLRPRHSRGLHEAHPTTAPLDVRECGKLALDEEQRDEFRDRYERAKRARQRRTRRVEGCRPAGPEGVDVPVLR